jgi:hypothetical protein
MESALSQFQAEHLAEKRPVRKASSLTCNALAVYMPSVSWWRTARMRVRKLKLNAYGQGESE